MLEKLPFLHWIAIVPLSKINWLYICASIFWLYSVPLINDSIVSPVWLFWLLWLYHKSKASTIILLILFFFFSKLFCYNSYVFTYNFGIISSVSTKYPYWIFILIHLDPYISLRKIGFLSISSLLIHEHGISFHLFGSFFFTECFLPLVYRFCMCL